MEWELADVYSDGVLRMEIIGGLVRIIHFRWAFERGERIKRPVVAIVKPLATLWGQLENAGCEIVRLTPERPKLSA